MKVAIIGVTGRIGKRIARELVQRGHAVSGGNRRPRRVADLIPDLDIDSVAVDTADPDSVYHLLQGKDVAILATAPTRENPAAYVTNNKAVLAAAKRAGVSRLIAISNYKALRAPDGRSLLEAEPPHPYFVEVESVHAAEHDFFRDEKDMDWLLVSPPAELFPYGEVTGQYRVGGETLVTTDPASLAFKDSSKISMEDFAHFIASEIERPAHHHALINLAY